MSKILIDEAVVKLAIAKEALEKLAKLGNGDRYGNSIGNSIAMEALDKMADNARELGLSYEQEPVADDRLALIAHNIDPGDWNDLGFRDSWYRGFRAGFREAENEHNIRMEK